MNTSNWWTIFFCTNGVHLLVFVHLLFSADRYINQAHVSNRLRFHTFLTFIISFETLLHERACSIKLSVLSKLLFKISQISQETACAGQKVNLKCWFIYEACTFIINETLAHRCFSVCSSEFLTIPCIWSTPGWALLVLYLTYSNQENTSKWVFNEPCFTEKVK